MIASFQKAPNPVPLKKNNPGSNFRASAHIGQGPWQVLTATISIEEEGATKQVRGREILEPHPLQRKCPAYLPAGLNPRVQVLEAQSKISRPTMEDAKNSGPPNMDPNNRIHPYEHRKVGRLILGSIRRPEGNTGGATRLAKA